MTDATLNSNDFLDQKNHQELEELIRNTNPEKIKDFILDRCSKILFNFGQPCQYYSENSLPESASINTHLTEIINLKDVIFSENFEDVIVSIYENINSKHNISAFERSQNSDELTHTKEFCLFFCSFYNKMNCWYYGDNSGSVVDHILAPMYGDYTALKLKIRDLQTLLHTGDLSDDLNRYYAFLEKCNGEVIKENEVKQSNMYC